MTHTPGPWHHYRYSGLVPALHIIEPLTQGVTMQMSLHGATDANAAFIVKAVNCHDELLAAVRDLVDLINEGSDVSPAARRSSLDAARAAIAKATEATR